MKKGWMIMRIRLDGDTQPYKYEPYDSKSQAKIDMKKFASSRENKNDHVKFFLAKVYYS